MTNKLEPCPFCGGEAHGIEARTSKDFSVACTKCNIAIFKPRYNENDCCAFQSIDEAVQAWNRRATKLIITKKGE